MENRSALATAMKNVMDGIFTPAEWSEVLAIEQSAVEDWQNDRALPHPEFLCMLIDTIETSRQDDEGAAIRAFREVARKPLHKMTPLWAEAQRLYAAVVPALPTHNWYLKTEVQKIFPGREPNRWPFFTFEMYMLSVHMVALHGAFLILSGQQQQELFDLITLLHNRPVRMRRGPEADVSVPLNKQTSEARLREMLTAALKAMDTPQH